MQIVAALRDLQWRRRRFMIAIAGTSLVFGMTLLMTGVMHGFDAETASTIDELDTDAWVVRAGASGPFLGASPMAESEVMTIGALPGVKQAAPMVFTRKSVDSADGETDVNIFGAVPGRVGMPVPDEGAQPARSGEIMISSALHGYDVGDTIDIAGTRMHVVGLLSGSTALAGTPNVFVLMGDAQAIGFGGQPVASAIAVRGMPTALPAGFEAKGRDVASADLLRAIEKAKTSITLITFLLWLVATSIIGAVVYLTALERQRDFAVFKATGVATRSILGGLALQAAVLAVLAAMLGSVVGTLLAPLFPMVVSIELRAHLLLPLVALVIGLVASIAGLRRVVAVDPALAFGGP